MFKGGVVVPIIFWASFWCSGQVVFHQNTFNGGVTGGGFSAGVGFGQGIVDVFIEDNSSIIKAFLFAFSPGLNTSGIVNINNNSFTFDNSNIVNSFDINNQFYIPINIHAIDITDFVSSNLTNQYTIETVDHPEMPFRGIFAPYIYIEYLNPILPLVNTCIIINNQFGNGLSVNNIQNLNPIDVNFPVGFSIYSDRHSYLQNERTNVEFNDNYLGLIYGVDNVNPISFGGGVKGHFYYQNNTLFGLDDDVPNNTMNETDALCDVSPYLLNNATGLNFNLTQISYPNVLPGQLNLFLAYFLTYTSPCSPFSTNLLTSDTTTCPNAPVQLGASGGITYDWLPQTNLSCYNCPNPVFLGDSTTNYTVRIWASDSCSKVLPVRVRVSTCASLDELGGAFEIFAPTLVHGDLGTLYQIRIKNVQQYQYELYTFEGKVVYQKNGFPESVTIDLWDKALMESGLYLYRILVRDEVGNQEVFGGKVVVVR